MHEGSQWKSKQWWIVGENTSQTKRCSQAEIPNVRNVFLKINALMLICVGFNETKVVIETINSSSVQICCGFLTSFYKFELLFYAPWWSLEKMLL